MLNELEGILAKIDAHVAGLSSQELQKQFERIPLDILGQIQVDQPAAFSNILRWLPEMPSAEIQESWTGSSGETLMKQSVVFIRTVVSAYHAIACRPLGEGNVLDFGCGWGAADSIVVQICTHGQDLWRRSLG